MQQSQWPSSTIGSAVVLSTGAAGVVGAMARTQHGVNLLPLPHGPVVASDLGHGVA